MIRGKLKNDDKESEKNKGLLLKETEYINTMEQHYLIIQESEAVWE